MKANGADIKVTTKKGWGHGFEANYENLMKARFGIHYYIEDSGLTNKDAKMHSLFLRR